VTIRHPIIIIEGPDAVGKTTLARSIKKLAPDALYIHSRYHKDIWPYHAAALRRAVRHARIAPVIMDRHWPSECAYGRAFRAGPAARYNERALYRVLERYGACYVLAAPPVEVAVHLHEKASKVRPELFANIHHVATIYRHLWKGLSTVGSPEASYLEQLSRSGVSQRSNWTMYDLRQHSGDVGAVDFAARVLPWAYSCLHSAWPQGLGPSWNLAGTVQPGNTLLVGDQVSDRESAAPWPFFAPNGSSRYLSKVLGDLWIDEDRIAMVNATPLTPHAHEHELIREAAATCGRVVALGRKAADQLQELEIKANHVIRHPQHPRRFTHHDRSYHDELERAVDPSADARL
jgi:hypothetical protein